MHGGRRCVHAQRAPRPRRSDTLTICYMRVYAGEKFGNVVREYVRGRISRRQFIGRGAQLGLSAAVLAKMTRPSRAAANLIESDPVAPYESPITPERVAFLKP